MSSSRRGVVGGLLSAVICGWMASAASGQVSLFISDDNGVQKYDFTTSSLSTLVTDNSNPGTFTGLTVGPNGNLFVASSVPAGQVFQYNPVTGAQIGAGPFVFYEGTPPTPDPHDVNGPEGLNFSPINGGLYVADVTTSDVHRYDGSGNNLGAITGPTLVQPMDVAFDAAGNMYVGSTGTAEILKAAGGTGALTSFVPTQSGGLINPIALTFGPDGKLYVLDGSTGSIDRYNSNGSFDQVFKAMPLFVGSDLAFGPDGNLYVAGNDLLSGSSEVIRVLPNGADGGALISSGLMNPHFLAFAVPEPGTLGVMGLGILMLLRRKRNPD